LKFQQLYSSSIGNLYMVTAANGKRLMIECGVVWPKLQKALNYELGGIVGCLVSHEHADHSKAVVDVMKAGIDVYGSTGTLGECGVFGDRRALTIYAEKLYRIGDFIVAGYNSNHDAAEPLIYIIQCGNENLLFATDTSHINQRFKTPFDIIAIECSYNKEYLTKRVETGAINKELATRLLTSHMEEKEAMRYLAEFCDLSKCREIHLLHCSADNINKTRIKTEFEKRFYIETRTVEDCK